MAPSDENEVSEVVDDDVCTGLVQLPAASTPVHRDDGLEAAVPRGSDLGESAGHNRGPAGRDAQPVRYLHQDAGVGGGR